MKRLALFSIFALGSFSLLLGEVSGQVGAAGQVSTSTLATSTLPFEATATPSVFVDDVSLREHRVGTATMTSLNIHFVAPWTKAYRFGILEGDAGVIATSSIFATSTATGTLSGAMSIPSPDYAAYTYRLWLCDSLATSSSCGISSLIYVDVIDSDAVQEIERPASDFTDSHAQVISDVDRKNWLAWVRALTEYRKSSVFSTTTYAETVALFPRYISPDKLYWNHDQGGATCSLDVIATKYSLLNQKARAECLGVASISLSAIATTSLVVNDIDLLSAGAKIRQRAELTQGVPGYASATLKTDFPILVGSYDPAKGNRRETQPSYLPLSKLNIIEYDGAHATSDGSFEFDDPYLANDQYYAGQCMSLECPHGLLTEFSRMKKANPKLLTVLRLRVSKDVLASSSLTYKFEQETMSFLRGQNFDGVDIIPESLEGISGSDYYFKSLVLKFKDNQLRQERLWVGVSASCSSLACMKAIKSVADTVDAIFVDSSVMGGTAHYILPQEAINEVVRHAKNASVPLGKVVIDIPSSGVIWANNSWREIDGRTIRKRYLGKFDFDRVYDARAASVSLVSSSTGFISYEDEESVSAKALFVLREQLGGVRILNILSDDGVLATNISKVIGETDKSLACTISMVPPRNLAENSRGRDVRALQDFLKCRDFIPGYIEINGNYGELTAAAVKLYQMSEGIDPVGTIGSSTRMSLRKYLLN